MYKTTTVSLANSVEDCDHINPNGGKQSDLPCEALQTSLAHKTNRQDSQHRNNS